MRFKLHIDPELCKGCELCVAVCQHAVLTMSADVDPSGYRRAEATQPDHCVGCRRCSDICPDAAIEIEREADDPPSGGAAAKSRETT